MSRSRAIPEAESVFDSLSPMVERLLHQWGRNLWGRTLLRKNYQVYVNRSRWVLCDAPKNLLSRTRGVSRTKLAVDLYNEGFRIAFEKAALPHMPVVVLARGVSEMELKDALEKVWLDYWRISSEQKVAGPAEAG